ncbi:MAG: ATP synthase F1 subunit gamma [Fimbriimonadaceae bacterium]|nr:ATP synthase F1 subunit gamma [Fimbriimonadaceae bacterium]QYK56931.1 MAG: ATP synthase F1 subunit gamma [Fimbriimonadaceae bacterium]
MATLKQIRQRIRTSKNIRQITRAMKLVAAARLNRAKMRVEEARPYAEKMREFMGSIGAAGELPPHPLLERRPVKKTLLLLVTGDRGLAGSYNTLLIRRAADFLRSVEGEVGVMAVGKKGSQFFGKRGYSIVETITVPTAGARLEDAVLVTDKLRKLFEDGSVDAIHICYSKFYSPIRQVPQVVQLLPIEPPRAEENEAAAAGASKEYKFEPEPVELLALLLPKYLLTVVYQAMLEASASEHGARMTAMTSATDNAGKMIADLTLSANRARQAGITKEILEIVAGAEALKA